MTGNERGGLRNTTGLHGAEVRTTLTSAPGFAVHDGSRAVETREVAGVLQAVAWDRATGGRRQITTSPQGVDTCEIEPDGRFVWWFDANPAGEGSWLRQSFTGGETRRALGGVPAGRMYGVAFDGRGTVAAVGVGTGDESRCYLGTPGGPGRLVLTAPGYLGLVDLAPGGELVALGGRPDGARAVSLYAPETGGLVARLGGDRRRRMWALEFRPDPGAEPELLLAVEEDGRYTVATWRASGGLRVQDWLSFDSEISARWYGDDHTVLVQHDHAGRSRLLTAHLGRRDIAVVPTPAGTVVDLACAPDGAVHAVWSREGVPPGLLTTRPGGGTAAPAPGTAHGRRRELWTEQPYGRIHSFLATPPGPGPWPTMFLVHGGPSTHDRDSYDPRVEALLRAGYAVVRTNYRGSTGYGPRWQHGFGHRVGLAQLEDLAAVRRHVVESGVSAADRVGLCGHSWGGYLVLLAMGAQPGSWAVGLAASPVADYVAAYHATTPALREVDEELFGGTPDEVPERYLAASPMSYVDAVRGPLLVVASADDAKCPAEQIERYAAALRRRDVPHQLTWVGGGHQSHDAADHAAAFGTMLRYARNSGAMRPPELSRCAQQYG
jgi:dipeptidyl aminopeptidase/acylaminoacyl peptidase